MTSTCLQFCKLIILSQFTTYFTIYKYTQTKLLVNIDYSRSRGFVRQWLEGWYYHYKRGSKRGNNPLLVEDGRSELLVVVVNGIQPPNLVENFELVNYLFVPVEDMYPSRGEGGNDSNHNTTDHLMPLWQSTQPSAFIACSILPLLHVLLIFRSFLRCIFSRNTLSNYYH